MKNREKFRVSVRDWIEPDGRPSFVVCFFSGITIKPKYCRVIECGERPTDAQNSLIQYLIAENVSFICKFADVDSAIAFYQIFAGKRPPKAKVSGRAA